MEIPNALTRSFDMEVTPFGKGTACDSCPSKPPSLQRVWQHLPPPGPVVVHVLAPVVEPGRHALADQDPLERAGLAQALLLVGPLADQEGDGRASHGFQEAGILEPRQVSER